MLVKKHHVDEMLPELDVILGDVRRGRAFNVHTALARKVDLLNAYFCQSSLSAAVVGVSGGVDSAVVVGLLALASRMKSSPIKRVVAISLPFVVDQGASNQSIATERGRMVAQAFGVEYVSADLGSAFNQMRGAVAPGVGIVGDAWADGQLVAYLRTPALYYLSALLTAHGTPAIVCGTTNRDEGSYLGFFGKASDGMVDLQVISDLHKSEVYALARQLGVPTETIDASPTGDVFDGKTHREMIGAPYDFVELYTHWLAFSSAEQEKQLSVLSAAALSQFREWGERIEAMHRYNSHKYVGGNPSVHLDIYPRGTPGGWREEGGFVPPVESHGLVGEFRLNPLVALNPRATLKPAAEASYLHALGDSAQVFDSFITKQEAKALLEQVAAQRLLPVGRNGIRKDYRDGVSAIGSFRATAYSPELADTLWERLRPFLPEERLFNHFAHTDWCGHARWRPVGINPAFRYIWYEQGGELVVHYDAGYNPGDGRTHTLMSLVLYLTSCDPVCGGRTRFIRDAQLGLPYALRDFSDWSRQAEPDEVIEAVVPHEGRLLIFDHRLLHDSEPWHGKAPKVIIRSDIVFERA
jgi:NAD+ synthetase